MKIKREIVSYKIAKYLLQCFLTRVLETIVRGSARNCGIIEKF
jgi:hypothetical protein